MTHGSLFNGIGGFMLAAAALGWDNIFHCEVDPFCNHVIKKKFKSSVKHGKIQQTDFNVYRNKIGLLSGGDPCQPSSVAGLGKGTSDDRYLWPENIKALGNAIVWQRGIDA